MAVRKFDRESLLMCADEVLAWVGLQDPMFSERIQISKDEYHWDALQVVAAYCCQVLQRGEHMWYPELECLQPGYIGHLGPRACAFCKVEFTPARGTDTVCEKPACMDKQAKLLDAQFEAAHK